MVRMVTGAGPEGVAMELKQHRHGPESGTGSHGSNRNQGQVHIHCKKERFVKAGHWMGGLHWVYEVTKLHTGTGQKSNRLCSKVSKIQANRIKYKI